MHSKKVNAVVVVCDSNNKPLREYSVNSGIYSREADIYLPFDTEYKFLIKNNNSARMKVEIDIDGASIGSPIIIDANSSGYIERFVDVAKKFKFVSIHSDGVADPTSDENGKVHVKTTLEVVAYGMGDDFWLPRRNDFNDWEPQIYSCNVVYDVNTGQTNDHGATVEGSDSDQLFGTTDWNGNSTNHVFHFNFNLKHRKEKFSDVELKEIETMKKLNEKYQYIDSSKIGKKMKAEIITIIDASGSMESLTYDTIGGYNSFIREQYKSLGEDVLVSLVLFNTKSENVYSGVKISQVPKLTENEYRATGGTALVDTVCKTINDVGYRLSKMNETERPEKVIISILTDGEENSSIEFKTNDLKEMIEHQRSRYNWEFVFLGANQDSFLVADSYGISRNMTMNYSATSDGIKDAYASISCCVTNYINK